jgi:hypothetical protein
MTAGHNALRGSGPGQQLAYKNAMTHVGRLIAGSTGSALRAVRPANIAPVTRRDFVHRTSAKGSLYRSPLAINHDVLFDGVLVGRIVLSPSAPNDHQCHRDRTPTRGYEPPSPARCRNSVSRDGEARGRDLCVVKSVIRTTPKRAPVFGD